MQHYEDVFESEGEMARFRAQFDGVADNVLWLPDGITATYRDRNGAAVELAKRRGLVPGPAPTKPQSSEGEADT